MIVWTLAVSDQAKEVVGGRAGTAMPKILSRQEFISHGLENPSQNTCELQIENLFPWGTEQSGDSFQASFSVMKGTGTEAIFFWQIGLPTTSFTSLLKP